MGRTKYSPETVNTIMASFVKATKQTIEEMGFEAASIRRVSTSAGYSSATLYLYFEDMNELVTMSLISYLNDYVKSVAKTTPDEESAEEAYLRTWELFCTHAFAKPQMYLNLFFGPQSRNLNDIARKYYELFPEELEKVSGRLFDMLSLGNLHERNKIVLEELAPDLNLSSSDADLVNDLTIAYFHSFLLEAASRKLSKKESEDYVKRFMEGALFVLHGHRYGAS